MNSKPNRFLDFKNYLQGEKSSYPTSLMTEAMNKLLQQYEFSCSDIYDCDDCDLLNKILKELKDKKNPYAIKALEYGNNACRPALKLYINYLKGIPYKQSVSSSASLIGKTKTTPTTKAIDGLDILIELAKPVGGLLHHMVENTFFINPANVITDSNNIMHLNGLLSHSVYPNHYLPVRYSTKLEYYDYKGNILAQKNKGKKNAIKLGNKIYQYAEPGLEKQDRGCLIEIDKDNNSALKDKIHTYTNHWVSCGNKTTIKYYMISHIWGETYDPLFFSSLWNIAITPLYCSPILDKNPAAHPIMKYIQEFYQALCYKLYLDGKYTPTQLDELFRNKSVPDPRKLPTEVLQDADDCIKGKWDFKLNFI